MATNIDDCRVRFSLGVSAGRSGAIHDGPRDQARTRAKLLIMETINEVTLGQ
jgi:hypothetical protein